MVQISFYRKNSEKNFRIDFFLNSDKIFRLILLEEKVQAILNEKKISINYHKKQKLKSVFLAILHEKKIENNFQISFYYNKNSQNVSGKFL